jgi:hypothetical protein
VECPHCHRNLLRKQRSGGRCSRCRRPFAFDPKTNHLRLHDLRVMRLAQALSDGGRLRYTPGQLAVRAGRRERLHRQPPLPGPAPTVPPPRGSDGLLGCSVTVGVLAVGCLGALLAIPSWRTPAGIGLGLLGGFAVLLVAVAAATRMARSPRALAEAGREPPLPAGPRAFFGPWLRVYRTPPPGMVWPPEWPAFTDPPPPTVEAVVACPDREVLACLAANGVPERLGVSLTSDPALVPGHLPVVLLHDAGLPWCRYAARLRRSRPGPVVTAALRPRQVMATANLPSRWVRGVTEADVHAVAALEPLTADELAWLRTAWTPLLELSPRQLVLATERAVLRLGVMSPVVRSVGFLGAGA